MHENRERSGIALHTLNYLCVIPGIGARVRLSASRRRNTLDVLCCSPGPRPSFSRLLSFAGTVVMNTVLVRRIANIFKLLTVCLLAAGLLAAVPAAAQLSVPLTVQEMTYPGVTGVARTSEPVTMGIPLAKGVVPCGNPSPASCSGVSALGLTGVTVGQFRCLVEWEDQSCKWVLVDTQVSLAAGSVNTSVVLNNTGAGS